MVTHTPPNDNPLLDVTNFAEEYLPYATQQEANRLSNLLIIQKKLPTFYFAQAADELDIAPHVYKHWRTHPWNLHPIYDEDKLRKTLRILIRVTQRLAPHNAGLETYSQAMDRLKRRVNQLEQTGISYNRLANYLHISFRTLTDISKLTYSERQRPRRCPWDMLKALENAELEIPRLNHSHILSRGAPRGKKAAHEIRHQNSHPDPSLFTPPRGPCIKCKATWANLYYDGQDIHHNHIYTCRLCGKSSLVRHDPQPSNPSSNSNSSTGPPTPDTTAPQTPPRPDPNSPNPLPPPYVQRYTNCWNCNSPWHNLSKDHKTPDGYTVYTCIICTETNIVPPAPTRSRAPKRSK